MENENVMTVDSVEAVQKPKHKWLTKGSRFAKKAVLAATVFSTMATTCGIQAFAASGVVDTSSFIFHFFFLLIFYMYFKNPFVYRLSRLL